MTAEEKLLKSYEKTQKELEEKLAETTSGNMKQYYRKLLEEIEKAIKKLKQSAAEYAAASVSPNYMQNALEIFNQYRRQKLTMQPPSAFKQQHSDAIYDLRREVQAQIEEGLAKAREQAIALVEQARRQAQSVPDVQEIQRQIIAETAEKSNLRRLGLEVAQHKVDTAGTVVDMQQEMKRLLEKEGILKVEVGSGEKKRSMSVTNYSVMVARSTSREVGNTARINQMTANGYDLVEIPPHYPTCEICATLQNRVYSISGKDKRFPPLSRALGAYKNIHPNCRHVVVGWAEGAYTPQEIEEAIRRSNRSWEDPRTGEEIRLYNSLQNKSRKARDMRAQYDRYKKRLGDDAPKSFYAFKRIKNAGGDKWEEMRNKYRDKGIVDNAVSCGIIKTDKQFGKKIGKHAEDFGLNAALESDREKMNAIIDDIFSNNDEIRIGKWSGQHSDVVFYIKDENVVITKQNGEFVTILKGGIYSGRIKDARRIKI